MRFSVTRGSKADRAIDAITGALYAALTLIPESKPKDGSK